ncbi:MAG: LysR family transcriptional regulator [Comamonadaceae bacterium]|nr:LysR family transcriptional regulator [Comamonadaceae bacterium]
MATNTFIPLKNDAAPSGADLSLLLVFEAVYAERQISRAAQRLGLAQPTVSNALGRLRRLTGDALFVRTGRGMEPTPHAERLAAPLREALAMLRGTLQARSQFDPAHDRRHFTLFLTDLGEAFFLPRLLARLRDAAPGVTLTTLPMPDLNPQAALERGEVDLAIGNLPDLAPGFYQQRLFREHYVAIMRPDHPLLGGAMNAERFAVAHHAVVVPHGTGHSAVEQALVDRGLASRIVLRVQNFLVLPAIVSNTDLIALVPRSAALTLAVNHSLGQLPSPIEVPAFVVRQCWHERFHGDAANQWLRVLVAELFMEGQPADKA